MNEIPAKLYLQDSYFVVEVKSYGLIFNSKRLFYFNNIESALEFLYNQYPKTEEETDSEE